MFLFRIGGRVVDKHCLYDANLQTKINNVKRKQNANIRLYIFFQNPIGSYRLYFDLSVPWRRFTTGSPCSNFVSFIFYSKCK
jgi:hypothetical protein